MCLCVPFIQRYFHYSVRISPFFSYFLCYHSSNRQYKGFFFCMSATLEASLVLYDKNLSIHIFYYMCNILFSSLVILFLLFVGVISFAASLGNAQTALCYVMVSKIVLMALMRLLLSAIISGMLQIISQTFSNSLQYKHSN